MTKCWDCKNACGNGCSWFKSQTPVKGWTARPTHPRGSGTSYEVRECPEFKQDWVYINKFDLAKRLNISRRSFETYSERRLKNRAKQLNLELRIIFEDDEEHGHEIKHYIRKIN